MFVFVRIQPIRKTLISEFWAAGRFNHVRTDAGLQLHSLTLYVEFDALSQFNMDVWTTPSARFIFTDCFVLSLQHAEEINALKCEELSCFYTVIVI